MDTPVSLIGVTNLHPPCRAGRADAPMPDELHEAAPRGAVIESERERER